MPYAILTYCRRVGVKVFNFQKGKGMVILKFWGILILSLQQLDFTIIPIYWSSFSFSRNPGNNVKPKSYKDVKNFNLVKHYH